MNYIWIDSIDFKDRGQWKLDTQFSHLMGSSYLLACHQPGVPVEDAKAEFDVPEEGLYKVWVRTRNWYHPYSPGLFNIEINSEKGVDILGNGFTHDWYWQPAGEFELSAGKAQLKLCDQTGYFARVAAVLITDDFDFVPAHPVSEYEKERAKFRNISLEPEYKGEYDVVIAGGGPGGISSAIAAAREGAKTLLITSRPVLGGNGSTEAGVRFHGASSRQPNAREGGITEEIMRNYFHYGKDWTTIIEELCSCEDNLTVLYSYFVTDCLTVDNTIKTLYAKQVETGEYISVSGKMFVDCTGDGWLGYYAKAKFRLGRESKKEFNEEFAPNFSDTLTMSGCNMGSKEPMFKDVGYEVPFEKPSWAPEFPKGEDYGRNIEDIAFAWWLEAPNVIDDVYNAEMARDELFRIVIGHFNYLKNLWDEKDRAKNYVLWRMPYYDAKRESRRLVGDYILTQNDCVEGRDFPDTVCHAGWPIDLHNPKGIYSGKEGPFFSNTHLPLVKIPFRCLYSKNINNLMFAGRNISVTHIALGTTRLQNTILCQGQAVGTACAMCVDKGITPRALYEDHISELQQLLIKNDQYIPGVKNEDPADLARSCKVTASSQCEDEYYYPHIGVETDGYELDKERATFFSRGVSSNIESVWTKLSNKTDCDKKVAFHVLEQADPDGYTSTDELKTVEITVPAGFSDFIELKLDLKVEARYLWLWAEKCDGVFWHTYKSAALDHTRSEREDRKQKFENIRNETHCVLLSKPEILKANCSPENVINGYSRIKDAKDYMWVSSEKESLPQWLELSFDSEKEISGIYLTFDSDMTNPSVLRPVYNDPIQLVTGYNVEVLSGEQWVKVAQVEDNILRRRIHHFESIKTKKVRVNVLASNDNKTARIIEVRLY